MRRQYSEDDKSAVLAWYAANGNNLRKTAREWKITPSTLQRWIRGEGINDAVRNCVPEKRAEIADRLEELCHKLIDSALGKADDADLQPTMVGIGIAVEKMRLAREQPTSISKNANLTDDERAKRTNELLDTARARRTGQPTPAQPLVQ